MINQINTRLIDDNPGLLILPDVKKVIMLFTRKILSEYPEKIVNIILYGSYARGEFHQESDIDILVLTTDDSWNIKKGIMTIGFDMYPEFGIMISAKVMTEEQFSKIKKNLFMQQVSQDGIAVV
ncbi:MAG: nucleotidyltransferase domain-containing protein [Methanomicrobiales archaeon]|nr:nucleotidyltransferase domain-containing protein [Methanomicrobiales archaeon]